MDIGLRDSDTYLAGNATIHLPMIPDAIYDEEQKIVFAAQDVYVPDPRGLGYAFYIHMRKNRNILGQIDTESEKTETFGSMLKRAIRTAMSMQEYGIQPGDIICICSVNTLDNHIPFIASQLIGAVVASLDPTISLVDTQHLVKQVDPKLVFVSSDSVSLIEESIRCTGINAEIVVMGEHEKYSMFSTFSAERSDENDFKPYEVDDTKKTAVILFSSGTTGLSKGICIHHYGLAYQAHNFLLNGYDLTCLLSYASTYWISSVILICVSQIFGKTRLIVPKYDPAELWFLIDRFKISFIFMAPSQAIRLLKSGRPEGVDTTSLRDIAIGGGPLSAENNAALSDLLPGTYVHILYGQSEASGLLTAFRPCDRRDVLYLHNKRNSCGRPICGHTYKIVDPETEELLGPNQTGELRFFSEGQMNGYYKVDSSSTYDSDGWIKTGDIAYFDEDLCFFIVDRIKEMLKFQGFHIPPAKLEGVLLGHPQVDAAVVIGIENEEDGDHPMGLVVLKPGSTVGEEELVHYVEERVDDRNRLRAGVKILKAFPYTPSGKIKKNVLKNMVLAGKI